MKFLYAILTGILLSVFPIKASAIDFGGFERFNVTKWSLKDTKLLEVKDTYLDYMHYTFAAEPFMLPNVPTNRIDLHLNLELLNRTLFIDNMVHSETDQYQYRLIGWNYRFGIHLGDYVDVYFEHFSQHLLDTTSLNGTNSYDAVGARIYFYKRKD